MPRSALRRRRSTQAMPARAITMACTMDSTTRCAVCNALCTMQRRPFLRGLRVDYSDKVVGGGFLFSNPNAKKTCGCSRTFDVKEAAMEKAEFAP